MKKALFVAAIAVLGILAWADPVVDGKVSAREYAHTQAVIDGAAVLNWAGDGQGGLYLSLTAKTKGWAAVGLGSQKMAGAYIYIGYVGADGKAVFSEQVAKGHRHTESGKKTADKSVVTLTKGTTVLEFHIPAKDLPFTGKTVPFVTAFSDAADLVTFHNDSIDSGTFTFP